MGKQYSEQELKAVLGRDMAESEIINRKMQEAYAMIAKSDRQKKNNGLKRAGIRTAIMAAGAAAALLLGFGVCAANPVLAAKIPLIGRIFQVEEKKVSYPGDYSEKAERLSPVAKTGTETVKENNPYSQISDGIAFTISECYADNMAMYLADSRSNLWTPLKIPIWTISPLESTPPPPLTLPTPGLERYFLTRRTVRKLPTV